MNQNSSQASTNTEVSNDTLKAIYGEYTTIACYERLANQTLNDEIKNAFLKLEMMRFDTTVITPTQNFVRTATADE